MCFVFDVGCKHAAPPGVGKLARIAHDLPTQIELQVGRCGCKQIPTLLIGVHHIRQFEVDYHVS